MQDLLSQLAPTTVVGLIIVATIALVVVVLLARRLRKRQAPPGEGLGPSLDAPVDYTSLPLDEEPRGWRDRFARLSLAGKILAVLVPLLAILGILALVLTLMPPGEPTEIPPTLVAVTVRVEKAAIVRPEPMTVGVSVVTTGLDDGEEIEVEMLEDGQAFAWFNPEQIRSQVRRNRAEFEIRRAEGAPTPTDGHTYTVIARTADGSTTSEAVDLTVPTISGIADAFFGRVAAAPPTATPEPTVATPEPTVATPEATPEPTATPAPSLPEGPAASVANGGNVRRLPIRTADNVIGGINAGEQVQLIERTPNGEWYRVRTVRDELGWVSASLLSVPAGTQVPVANVVTVFTNGPVYEQANSASTEVDRVNQGEVVQLLLRTSEGDWYQVTNVRDITGWVPANLLGVPETVAASVPVAP